MNIEELIQYHEQQAKEARESQMFYLEQIEKKPNVGSISLMNSFSVRADMHKEFAKILRLIEKQN